MEKIYGNRSARDLDRAGGYFQRHMAHMTSENLNSKGDIALELAHRDMEIDALRARFANWQDDINAVLKQRDDLRFRVARLEEALKEIATLYWIDAPAPEEMRRIARRALEEK